MSRLIGILLALISSAVATSETLPEEGSIGHDLTRNETLIDDSDNLKDFASIDSDEFTTDGTSQKVQNRYKRFASYGRAPSIVYLEILVIVDYDTYLLHGRNNAEIEEYFMAFFKGVDRRFRTLRDPQVKFSIVDIIRPKNPNDTRYFKKFDGKKLVANETLYNLSKYVYKNKKNMPEHDIAVVITKLDLCRKWNCENTGIAYDGGACLVNERLQEVHSVAIIEDNGGFSGIITAAHEIGHLLGAVHDGSPQTSGLGGPGGQPCRWKDGYIMSDLRHTERGFHWSSCSVNSFRYFLNNETAKCLYNDPHGGINLGHSLPGTLLSLDEQCQKEGGTNACFKDERVCANLFCVSAQTNKCSAWGPAAEGSSCGDNLHCLDGRCTPIKH